MVKHDLLARGIASVVGAIVNGLQTTVNNLEITVANHATYSTTEEVVIGTYDGKPLYRKALLIPNLPSNTELTTYPHEIANVDKIMIAKNSYAKNNTSNLSLPLPFIFNPSSSNIYVYADTEVIFIKAETNRSTTSAIIWLEYTKTTD